MAARKTLALLLVLGLCALPTGALSRPRKVLAAQPTTSETDGTVDHHHDDHDHEQHEDEKGNVVVRCRFCGATVAFKKDYIGLHDTSKAVASKRESILGDDGELHTFVNPSRVEMDLAGFKKSYAVESEAYTSKATFFENYNWRDVHCSSCKRHLGWKFHHDELQQCVNAKAIEAITAKTKTAAAPKQDTVDATTSEKERKAKIVQDALEGDCIIATSGWWSYQVCYGKEVRQYHEEADGTRPSDWSMGVYVEDGKASDTPDFGTDVVQYFAGGQHCDENGELRNTKVTYTCCKTKPQVLSIDSVEEPSLCSYIINVCVPELCDGAGNDAAADSTLADIKKYAELCETELADALAAEHDGDIKKKNMPPSFTTLRWSTVISEDSSELDWARRLKFKA
ncbi:Os-9 protein, partial [Globisporangium splendens]